MAKNNIKSYTFVEVTHRLSVAMILSGNRKSVQDQKQQEGAQSHRQEGHLLCVGRDDSGVWRTRSNTEILSVEGTRVVRN